MLNFLKTIDRSSNFVEDFKRLWVDTTASTKLWQKIERAKSQSYIIFDISTFYCIAVHIKYVVVVYTYLKWLRFHIYIMALFECLLSWKHNALVLTKNLPSATRIWWHRNSRNSDFILCILPLNHLNECVKESFCPIFYI